MKNSEWPKKMPTSEYAKRWYTSRTKESVINDIKRGLLPGVQEANSQWFVWVNADQTAARDYSPPTEIKSKGATLAEQILMNMKKAS